MPEYIKTSLGNTILKNPNDPALVVAPPTIPQPVSMTSDSLPTVQPIVIPPSTVVDAQADSLATSTTDAERARTTLDAKYAQQLKEANDRAAAIKKSNDEFNAAAGDIINKADPTQRGTYQQEQRIKQNELDAAENASKTLTTNFDANQALTNELDSLLTQGNLIAQKLQNSKIPGLAGIQQSGRSIKNLQTIQGRAGVIQAVMSARSGQISAAYNFIDKAKEAVTADANEQIGFYNTLLSLNQTKKADAENAINLSADQKAILTKQVGLLEAENTRIQENADALKDAMTNQATALLYANAGITLQDTPEQIASKLSKQVYVQEVRDNANAMEGNGYQQLTPEQAATKPATDLVRYTDSKGVQQIFYKTSTSTTDVREVDGGLFDVKNNKWLVPRKSTTTVMPGAEVVGYYADQVRIGKIALENVPAETRNAVVQSLSAGIDPATQPIGSVFDYNGHKVKKTGKDTYEIQ